MLLERTTDDVTTAVGRVGGLQAQYPNEPHIGLAARLERFRPTDPNGALDRGDLIRATLMRGTVHVVTRGQAAFALTSTALIHHRAWHDLIRSKRVPVGAMRAAVIKWCSEEPRTQQEITEWLLQRFPDFPEPAHQIWRVVSATGDLIHSAPSGLSLSRIRAALSRLELGPRFPDEDGNELSSPTRFASMALSGPIRASSQLGQPPHGIFRPGQVCRSEPHPRGRASEWRHFAGRASRRPGRRHLESPSPTRPMGFSDQAARRLESDGNRQRRGRDSACCRQPCGGQ